MTLSTSMNRDVEGLELKEKKIQSLDFGSQTGVKNLLYGSYAEKFLQAICGEAGPVAFHCNPVVAMRRGEEKSRMRGKPTSILLKYA